MRRRDGARFGPGRERGLALLVAILIVALGTVIATAVAYENAMTARRGVATFAFDQSILVAEGAEALAAYGLRQIVQSSPKQLYLYQGWDKPIGPIEIPGTGAMLEASLEDLQGRFNLNNLVKSDGTPDVAMVTAFNQLLAELGLEEKWTGYIIDWIDMDGTPSIPEGAEDSVYMGQTLPYRTANRYITSASELLALPGFGRDRYMKLAPYVTALPYNTPINVCTASGAVLDAFLGEGHTEFSDENTLAKNRENAGACFPTVQNYQAAFDPKVWAGTAPNSAGATAGVNPAAGAVSGVVGAAGSSGAQGTGLQHKFGQTSSYFRLTTVVTVEGAEFNLYSLLYQDAQAQMVRPIQRSFTPD